MQQTLQVTFKKNNTIMKEDLIEEAQIKEDKEEEEVEDVKY